MRPPLIGPTGPPDLHVMTFNVRRRLRVAWRPADRWRDRKSAVAALLRTERPTLLGAQETLPDQVAVLREALGAGYRSLGYPRRGTAGAESNPILFDEERLELREWHQYALSDQPERRGSRTWGNLITRAVVIARLRDRATGAEFVALNTHLDHLSAQSRLRSAQELRRRIAQLRLPAIVTADFNAPVSSPAVRHLLQDGALADAWSAASERLTPAWGTFPNYTRPRVGAKRIDGILVTPDIAVARAAVNATRIDGRWPSDHMPVQALVRVPVAGGSS